MFSDPVVGGDFFGRQEILDLLVKRANALKSGYRQNVALIGHQQLGKTSLLRHFLHTYRDSQILAIYVEIKLQALDTFVEQFIRSLLYQFLVQQGAVDPAESLSRLKAKAEPFVPKTVARIGDITNLIKQRHPEEAYSRLFELTSVIRQETGKHCIVVLDEFHRLGELGIKNAFSNFGKRIMVQKDTMYLVSSSSFSASKKILVEKLALLFGNFERIYLEPFDFETSFDFLEKKLSPVRLSEDMKYFLVAFTDGYPFFLETIASRVLELSSAKGEGEVSRPTVATVLLRLLYESQGIFHQFFLKWISPWSRPKARGRHLLVLAAIARGANRLKDIAAAAGLGQREASAQIQELIEHELILKTGVFYRFHNKIFKFWLREVFEKKELSLLGMAAGAQSFLDRIQALIEENEKLLRTDASDHVLKLFALFRNDIVEFGEKRRKLPHFTEFIPISEKAREGQGSSRGIIARGRGRCWVCKITEEKATEKEVLELLEGSAGKANRAATPVLVALKGVEENAKLLAKDRRVLTLGLSRINMLMDIYGRSPIVRVHSRP
ncbi:MAG: AAA family ATPase [Candidatus Omnitrophota bacterium]